LLWFFVTLLPTSQILSIQNKMADRYLMFTVWSIAMLLPFLAGLLKNKRLGLGILVGFALLFGFLTFRQVGFWKDSESLWTHAAETEPDARRAWYQLAVTKRDLGKFDEEKKSLERLLLLDPEHDRGLNNYAINIYRKGANPKGAAVIYERLLAVNPNNQKGLKNYGHVLIDLGRFDEAVPMLERALSIDPEYCSAMNTLGRAYLSLGKKEAARQQFELALVCDPGLQSAKRNLERL